MLIKKYFKTKSEAEVTFEFSRDNAESVALVADFNNWEPIAMKFNKKTKVFRTKIRLPKDDDFHFRYLINENEWENDEQADNYVPNCFGTDDSVLSTRA